MRDCENGSSFPKCTLACTLGQSYSHTWPRGRRHGGERRDATKHSEFGTLFLSMRSLYGCDSASMHQHRVRSRCVFVWLSALGWIGSVQSKYDVSKNQYFESTVLSGCQSAEFYLFARVDQLFNHKHDNCIQIAQDAIYVRFGLCKIFDCYSTTQNSMATYFAWGSFWLQFAWNVQWFGWLILAYPFFVGECFYSTNSLFYQLYTQAMPIIMWAYSHSSIPYSFLNLDRCQHRAKRQVDIYDAIGRKPDERYENGE